MAIDFFASLIIIIPFAVLVWFIVSIAGFVKANKDDTEEYSKKKRIFKIAAVVFIVVGIAFAVTIYILNMALANFT